MNAEALEAVPDDLVQPFLIDKSGIAGRLVRLGPAVADILGRHATNPPAVQMLLAQSLALAAGLAAALKFNGIFTLQVKGDGPVPMLVVDVTTGGDIRGYAQVKGDVPPFETIADRLVPALLGEGYLAFTIDQGQDMERYQGIVSLDGATLEDCVRHYFEQSDQFASAIKLAAGQDEAGHWRAAALMLHRLPQEGGINQTDTEVAEEDWARASILMRSASPAEMLDPALSAHALLYRLFHEDGVRVSDTKALQRGCRCSRERMLMVLSSLPADDIAYLAEETGKIDVTCEFCTETQRFDPAELELGRA